MAADTCAVDLHTSPTQQPYDKLTHLDVVSKWHYPGSWLFGTPIKPTPACGDRIELSRGWWPLDYQSWGLLLEHNTVVVFGKDSRSHHRGVNKDLTITMKSLSEFAGLDAVRINNRDDERFGLKEHNVPEKQIIWMRYKEFVETWPNHVSEKTNHNEAFVNLCRYGKRFSHQAGVYPDDFPEKGDEKCVIM